MHTPQAASSIHHLSGYRRDVRRDCRRRLLISASVAALLQAGSAAHAQNFQGIGANTGVSLQAVSADGLTVAGGNNQQAFRWTAMTGLTTLAPLSGYAFGGAGSVSADGSTPVGASVGFGGSLAFAQATRWTSGGTALGLGFLPGGNDSVATGVNANGSVIAGYSNSATSLPGAQEAFRWTTPAGMTGLGFLPGDTRSQAAGVNADGSVVVGISVGG